MTDERRAVSRLRRAAGQLDGVCVEPGSGRLRRRAIAGGGDTVFYSAGGGESGYIAKIRKTPTSFLPAATAASSRTSTGRRESSTSESLSRKSDGLRDEGHRGALSVDVPDRLSRRSIRQRSTSARSTSGRRPRRPRWTKISPDLTRHDPMTMGDSGGPITRDETGVETYATIFTIAPSPKDGNLIWTGSDDGYVQVTRDGGTNWKNVTPQGHARLRAHQPRRSVAASPRHGVCGGEPLSARRLRRICVPHGRLRARRGRRSSTASRRATSRARSAKTRRARNCSTSGPSTASTCRSMMARTGSR